MHVAKQQFLDFAGTSVGFDPDLHAADPRLRLGGAGVPLLLVVPFIWRRPQLTGTLLGVALGLVISDLVHHSLVLPLTAGNTGWHWP